MERSVLNLEAVAGACGEQGCYLAQCHIQGAALGDFVAPARSLCRRIMREIAASGYEPKGGRPCEEPGVCGLLYQLLGFLGHAWSGSWLVMEHRSHIELESVKDGLLDLLFSPLPLDPPLETSPDMPLVALFWVDAPRTCAALGFAMGGDEPQYRSTLKHRDKRAAASSRHAVKHTVVAIDHTRVCGGSRAV